MFYSVIDLKEKKIGGTTSYGADFRTKDKCSLALENLAKGKDELSRRTAVSLDLNNINVVP